MAFQHPSSEDVQDGEKTLANGEQIVYRLQPTNVQYVCYGWSFIGTSHHK